MGGFIWYGALFRSKDGVFYMYFVDIFMLSEMCLDVCVWPLGWFIECFIFRVYSFFLFNEHHPYLLLGVLVFASCSVFLWYAPISWGGGGGDLVSCLGRLLCRDEEEDRLRLLSRSPMGFFSALRCFFVGGIWWGHFNYLCILWGGFLGGGDEVAQGDILTGWGCLFWCLLFGRWGSRVCRCGLRPMASGWGLGPGVCRCFFFILSAYVGGSWDSGVSRFGVHRLE